MAGFFIFALSFVALLTLVVRLTRMRVRSPMPYGKEFGITLVFVALALGVWWFLTRGQPSQRIVQSLILPSPWEVLQSFKPLHQDQGLVRSAFASWLRVTTGFFLAAIVIMMPGMRFRITWAKRPR